nr:MAG: putative RNA-dependent RNA polymerase [Botourmiaviridae sp.]
MYAPGLSPVQELSIKTAAKAEGDPCSRCRSVMSRRLDAYQKARLSPQDVDPQHLERFSRAFAMNVPEGWDGRRSPYVPNGHATLRSGRRGGGNWVEDSFSEECRVEQVFRDGKARIVTLYSSYNVATLTPLHHSLYSFLKGRNWLLVGSPTDERLRYLRAGCAGNQWLSFDYESATDNIKTAYVQRAVDVLISKGTSLTEEEVRCLRVVANLVLDGARAHSGQPMGSPMSFPLLCLINKTVVDLALADLLSAGEIPFGEWTGHRCLINGDDLLTRSTSGGDLVAAVRRQGALVGLRVNESKTMVSPHWAEINSTAFFQRDEGLFADVSVRKKTNVSALWMEADVTDVLLFAEQATVSARGFGVVLGNNVSRLARQKIKTSRALPPWLKGVLLRKRAFREALTSTPDSSVPDAPNPFPMEAEPEGFSLTQEEVFRSVTDEVTRVRERGTWKELPGIVRDLKRRRKRITSTQVGPADRKTAALVIRTKPPVPEKRFVLRCLRRTWENKRREELLAADRDQILDPAGVLVFDGESCSPFVQIRELLKGFKQKRASPESSRGLGTYVFKCGCPDDPVLVPGSEEEVRFCE